MTKSKKLYELLAPNSIASSIYKFDDVYQPALETEICPFCKEKTLPKRFFFGIYTTSIFARQGNVDYLVILPMCLANLCFFSPLIKKASFDGMLYFGDVEKQEVRYISLDEFYQRVLAQELWSPFAVPAKPFKVGDKLVQDVTQVGDIIIPVLVNSLSGKPHANHTNWKEGYTGREKGNELPAVINKPPVIKKIKLYPELIIHRKKEANQGEAHV